jgi:hypothetical protein
MVVAYGSMAMSGLRCAAALCGCASSCAYERPYVSSYYQHACVQRMGAAAEHLQGQAWLAFLTLPYFSELVHMHVYLLNVDNER